MFKSVQTSKKNALIISSHIVECKRTGGFHKILEFLIRAKYQVDWVTTPMHIGWLLKNNDRENVNNFFKLWRGYSTKSNVFNFALPLFLPGKLSKLLKLSKTALKAPSWDKVRKRLHSGYDVIVIETVGLQYISDIRRSYPDAKVIYRPSDIAKSLTHDNNSDELEINMIDMSDITLCVDENQLNYYETIGASVEKINIFRNPLSSIDDISFLENYLPKRIERKSVVYVGVSFFDKDLVEIAASDNEDAEFIIIGPFDYKSHDNIRYVGSLKKNEFEKYLLSANVGIAPIKQSELDVKYGYTGKIISYMKYLLPIVATNSSNYLGVDGFINCKNDSKEFSNNVRKCLDMSIEERLSLRDGYLSILKKFEYKHCMKEFYTFLD